ncbi:MAG: signal recognition particle-docking protein FtsY [Chloroflexi bacterium]|nr:signal recognition particle-docking protein FtsY [Chloroflexota bacterium]
MFSFLQRRRKTEEGLQKSRDTWFGRLRQLFTGTSLSERVWEEAEELLVSADVGMGTTAKLLENVRARAQRERVTAPETCLVLLKEEMRSMLPAARMDITAPRDGSPSPGPLVVLVIGVNGSGKTTSVAKLASYFREEGHTVVLAAADTFRAAGIEQLQVWGQRQGVEVVAHRQGSDPGAVAYDAYQAARARKADILVIDTAGRLHTKHNLMEELKKVKRVLSRLDPAAPHHVLLVLDATTGQNGLAQARSFTEALGCTGIFLAKLDGTAKGGITLAIADQLKLPVLFIGTGEKLEDMAPFDPEGFVEALFAPAPQQAPL